MDYSQKYLKYKNKYNILKNIINLKKGGGNNETINQQLKNAYLKYKDDIKIQSFIESISHPKFTLLQPIYSLGFNDIKKSDYDLFNTYFFKYISEHLKDERSFQVILEDIILNSDIINMIIYLEKYSTSPTRQFSSISSDVINYLSIFSYKYTQNFRIELNNINQLTEFQQACVYILDIIMPIILKENAQASVPTQVLVSILESTLVSVPTPVSVSAPVPIHSTVNLRIIGNKINKYIASRNTTPTIDETDINSFISLGILTVDLSNIIQYFTDDLKSTQDNFNKQTNDFSNLNAGDFIDLSLIFEKIKNRRYNEITLYNVRYVNMFKYLQEVCRLHQNKHI